MRRPVRSTDYRSSLEVVRPRNGVVIVRRHVREAQVFVERPGRFHVVQGVEQHAGIAGAAGGIQDGLGQLAAQAEPTELRPHVEPLHLGGIGIVGRVQRPQRAAAGHVRQSALARRSGSASTGTAIRHVDQASSRRRAVPRIRPAGWPVPRRNSGNRDRCRGVGIVAEDRAHGLELVRLVRRDQDDLRRVCQAAAGAKVGVRRAT